ncbi:hypothetical protein M378DRAFT_19178 [Amanita muscaria Koide BX008]|uniref:Beta-ketoacyl synthase-like N-terminal domain-containing protein n=1 Tax=Amanita muscaria (strain Koide BX008) TaxID=946122 RepID=A0A0C2WDL6_AMAMK|nr:hypothetical protein M378DRAFT_19178 [Amanita muscaria Koide BX008]
MSDRNAGNNSFCFTRVYMPVASISFSVPSNPRPRSPKKRLKLSEIHPDSLAAAEKALAGAPTAKTSLWSYSNSGRDTLFFRISPREAKSIDAQRLFLHAAYEASEDASYVPNSYVHNLWVKIDVYYSTSTLSSFLSGRLSYAMQMSESPIVLDTQLPAPARCRLPRSPRSYEQRILHHTID